MKKILFLISNLGGGGAEKVLITLVNNLANEYDITVQTIFNEGIYRKQLNKDINYKTIIKNPNLNKKRIISRVIKYLPANILHKIFIKEKYDVEIGFLEGMSCKIISGANSSMKSIGWIHTDISRTYSFFYNKHAEKQCYKNLSKIVCVSNDSKTAFIKNFEIINEPIVIYNPIDKQNILDKSNEKINYTIRKKTFTLCAVGHLLGIKGFDRLIDAASQLINEGYSLDIWILGEGECEKDLKQKVNDLKLNNHIYFLGFIENPYAIMKLCDLYVCSSRFEGYSLTVAEAMVLGLPVLSTACTGPIELLDNGKYGMIVDNSTEGLYTGIKNILDDNNLLDKLKKKSQERNDFFDLNNTLSQVRNLLE